MDYRKGVNSKDSAAGNYGASGGAATTRNGGGGAKEMKMAKGGGDMRTQGSGKSGKHEGQNSKGQGRYIGS